MTTVLCEFWYRGNRLTDNFLDAGDLPIEALALLTGTLSPFSSWDDGRSEAVLDLDILLTSQCCDGDFILIMTFGGRRVTECCWLMTR